MLALIRSLLASRRLLKDFVLRDLKARYVGSSMGFFWSVIFPIINLFVYMFVFALVLKTRFHDGAGPREVAIWMLAGITVWAAFGETLSRSTNCLVENANLIKKVVFPSEVLPVYLALSSLINMCIGIPIILAGVAWFTYVAAPEEAALGSGPGGSVLVASLDGAVPPQPQVSGAAPAEAVPAREGIVVAPRTMGIGPPLVVLPLLFLAQGLFTIGLGYFLSTLNLFLRDTYHLIGVATTVWMFATPIFYPAIMVQQNIQGQPTGFGWILLVNPMHWLIECYRDVLVFADWPDWLLLGRFYLVAAIFFLIGGSFFMSQKKSFPDLL